MNIIEIDNSRTVIACFKGWNVVDAGLGNVSDPNGGDVGYEGTYYNFGTFSNTNESTGETYDENIPRQMNFEQKFCTNFEHFFFPQIFETM